MASKAILANLKLLNFFRNIKISIENKSRSITYYWNKNSLEHYNIINRETGREKYIYSNNGTKSISYNSILSLKLKSCDKNQISYPNSKNYKYSHQDTNFHSEYWSLAFLPLIFLTVQCSKKNKEDPKLQNDLILASKIGSVTKVKRLINLGTNVNGRHPYGWCPIHAAAINGNANVLQVLLENGADPNISDKFSNIYQVGRENRKTPFDVEIIREEEFSNLLNNAYSTKGCTALHYAVLTNSLECVKVLINFGADPNLKDESNHAPEEYSKDIGMKKMMEKLSENYLENKKKLDMEERRNFPLEQRVAQKIIGQENAIASVCGAIRRKENGWYDEEHPLVFLFLGSSGIGKTELAKQVAEYLKKGKDSDFIRLDMSEYQQKHEVAKFIGSPPGYIGHEDGGQLTKQLTKNPNAVVLFDEIEKAHPDLLTILLQLFDEGRLTDGKGKTIECKNAIFIMTSNLASDEIADYSIHLREEAKQKQQVETNNEKSDNVELIERITISKRFKDKIIQPILKRHFQRDEFLGRINDIIYFVPFSRPELLKLVTIEMDKWKKQAKEKNDITLAWDDAILDVLADGYNVHYGARSVKHEVERRIINQIALAYENGLITEGSSVFISAASPSTSKAKEATFQEIPIKIQVKNKKEDNFSDIDPSQFFKDPTLN